MIFLRNNVWRILPLAVAGAVWIIGYVYMHQLTFGICDSPYTDNGYLGCTDSTFYTLGEPAVAYGQWLIAAAVITLFARFETLKRWSIFALVYLITTTIALAFSPVSSGGIEFQERLTVAHLVGILFLIVTVSWVVIHTIILRRRKGAQ